MRPASTTGSTRSGSSQPNVLLDDTGDGVGGEPTIPAATAYLAQLTYSRPSSSSRLEMRSWQV